MSTTDNKLLADFLVENDGGLIKKRAGVYSTLDEFEIPDDDLILSDLKFDTDWNWLMRVVEKIEGLGFIFKLSTGSSTFLKKDEVLIWNDEFRGDSKIQATYNACVEFVKLYNNQDL